MPSPFPGMDPYIESPDFWSDFHHDLASEIRAQLNPHLQPRYNARLVTYVVYDAIELSRPHVMVPDVRVVAYEPPVSQSVATVASFSPPTTVMTNPEAVPLRLARVEIRAIAEQRLVTVIEILSPVNKRARSDARDEYLRKRRDLLQTDVHLLELDLLRAGERIPLGRPLPKAPYFAILSHGRRRPEAAIWAIQLWDTLPVLPIPLLDPDPDVPLNVAEAVTSVYNRGGYTFEIKYDLPPPPPPLSEDEAKWADNLLKDYRHKA